MNENMSFQIHLVDIYKTPARRLLNPTKKIKFNRTSTPSFVTGIFDPLGFAAPWIVKEKSSLENSLRKV
jgi:hypothetical protein